MNRPTAAHRSLCPINLSLEELGDRWTLLILRDMIFADRRHFRELLEIDEGISSNILAQRLKQLVERGLLTRADDPTHRQKAIYSLTEKGIALVPVFVAISAWSRRFLPASEELSRSCERLERGGPRKWKKMMSELRRLHIAAPRRSAPAARSRK